MYHLGTQRTLCRDGGEFQSDRSNLSDLRGIRARMVEAGNTDALREDPMHGNVIDLQGIAIKARKPGPASKEAGAV